jgi:hypothetical protein
LRRNSKTLNLAVVIGLALEKNSIHEILQKQLSSYRRIQCYRQNIPGYFTKPTDTSGKPIKPPALDRTDYKYFSEKKQPRNKYRGTYCMDDL